MDTKIEVTAQNLSELFEVAAVLVCKGYAQGTRKALFLACREIYGSEYGPSSTYELFNDATRLMRVLNLAADRDLIYLGGYSGKNWLDDKSRELLLMSLIWAKTYVDCEMVRDSSNIS